MGAAIAAAIAYTAMLAMNISFAAGGADSSGYLNEAKMFVRGQTSIPIEPLRTLGLDHSWIAATTPIGFTWGKQGTGTMAPNYPPGLPAHLAIAALLGGWKLGPFLVSPLAALGCGVMMFLTGRRLGLSRLGAFASAGLLLLLPQFVWHALQPVSDVVATFWTLVAVWCVLRSEDSARLGMAAGAAFAISVLVRPTNIVLILPLAVAARFQLRKLVAIAAGGLPFAIALLAYQWIVYGHPFQTSYGSIFGWLSAKNVAPSSRVFSSWLITISTPLVFPGGFGILFDRTRDLWIRLFLAVWFLVFFGLYSLWAPFSDLWVMRYLLPGMPGLIFGALLVLESIARTRVLKIAVVVMMALMLIRPAMCLRTYDTLNVDEELSVHPEIVAWTESHLPRNAVVMSGSFSGAFYYYTGRFSIRPNMLDNDRFQLLRAYLGVHDKQLYAVLSPVEMPPGKLPERFKGSWVKLGTRRDCELWRLDP